MTKPNSTVRDLIALFQTFDQDAVVCVFEVEDDAPVYFALEVVGEHKDTPYYNDALELVTGNVVYIL